MDKDVMVFIRFNKSFFTIDSKTHIEWLGDKSAIIIIPFNNYKRLRNALINHAFYFLTEIQLIKVKSVKHPLNKDSYHINTNTFCPAY